jgi:para-nitrobenzyl esterase
VDGRILPESPFRNRAPAVSANVPLMVGTTGTEFGIGWQWPEFEEYTQNELRAAIIKGHGRQPGERILAALRRDNPKAKPCDLFALWQSSGARLAAMHQATLKAAQGAAPAYSYVFAWNTPVLDSRIRSYHCAELPFVFANTDRCDQATGGGPAARALAEKVSDAWIRFARTGHPNHSGLPNWPAFTATGGATMIFDNTCKVVNQPDRESLAAMKEG